MDKYDELRKYAVFRYIVLVFVFCALGFLLTVALVISETVSPKTLNDMGINWMFVYIPFLLIFWVWRKPLWKQVKHAIGFLNKKAGED